MSKPLVVIADRDETYIATYEEKLNTIEISKQLNVSKQYVSKVLSKDSRYKTEKDRRKANNAIRQKERNIKYIKEKRFEKEQLNAMLEIKHNQACYELSGRKTINNRAFRNWNSSIYEYYDKSKEYKLINEFKNKTSYAIPKKINWH